ncbi:MAG TPA: hypothetical protein VM008_17480 [Phycisphaerae bacterium]|nr:hypothetical protein [Phycisphaerae bacterium]
MILLNDSLRRHTTPRHLHSARASAVVFMILLMAVLTTGMVATMGIVSGIQTQSSGVLLKRNAAFYAAEAGLQTAVWNMNNNPSPTAWLATFSTPPTRTMSNGCSYTLYAVNNNWPTSVTFQSVGSSSDGSVSTQATVTITNSVIAPGMAIGGGMSDSGTTTVAGNVQVVGAMARSGNITLTTVPGQPAASLEGLLTLSNTGKTITVPGNVLFNGAISNTGTLTAGTVSAPGTVQSGGKITNTGTITGSQTSYSSPNVSIAAPTVDTASLITQAQANGTMMSGGTLSSPTFNFNASPNGIIYILGPTTTISGTITVKGSGTLIVAGTLTTTAALGSSGSPVTMNLVTTGNLSTSGTSGIYLNGTLAVGGSYAKSGTTAVNGYVIVQGSISSSGNVTVTNNSAPAPPSFVHYTGSGGSGIQISNFTGATY